MEALSLRLEAHLYRSPQGSTAVPATMSPRLLRQEQEADRCRRTGCRAIGSSTVSPVPSRGISQGLPTQLTYKVIQRCEYKSHHGLTSNSTKHTQPLQKYKYHLHALLYITVNLCLSHDRKTLSKHARAREQHAWGNF